MNEETSERDLNAAKRLKRALHRFYAGNQLEGQYVVMTLTTPEDYTGDLHKAFVKFKLRLARAHLMSDYFAVREWNSKGTCEHIHIVMRCRRVCILLFRLFWTLSLYGHLIPNRDDGLVVCYVKKQYGDSKGLANYLAKYLMKDIGEEKLKDDAFYKRKGRTFWYSSEWIFRKWKAFTKVLWRFGSECEISYLHSLKAAKRANVMMVAVLGAWRRFNRGGIKMPWSITLCKELRQLGIEWYGVK